MKAIDLHNYEAYLLDYIEGRLSLEDTDALIAFVMEHPDLEIAIDPLPNLVPEATSFPNKAKLRKRVSAEQVQLDQMALEWIENGQSAVQAENIAAFVAQHPGLAAHWQAWQHASLTVEADIIYQNKASLKKDLAPASLIDRQMAEALEMGTDIPAQWTSDAQLFGHWKAFQASMLKADLGIQFPNKARLKKQKVMALWQNPVLYRAVAAAVVLLLMVIAAILWQGQEPANRMALQATKGKSAKFHANEITEFPPSENSTEPILQPIPRRSLASAITSNQKDEKCRQNLAAASSLALAPILPAKAVGYSLPEPTPLLYPVAIPEAFQPNGFAVLESEPSWVRRVARRAVKAVLKQSPAVSQWLDTEQLARTGEKALENISGGTLRLERNPETGKSNLAFSWRNVGFEQQR